MPSSTAHCVVNYMYSVMSLGLRVTKSVSSTYEPTADRLIKRRALS